MSKVLIVEDSIDCLQPLKSLLQLDGHEVECAKDGLEALAKLEWFRPDKVVTDLMMPRMDGVGMIQAMRSDPRFARLPVVVFTAWSSDTIRRGLERLGVTSVHLKGKLNVEDLLKSVQGS